MLLRSGRRIATQEEAGRPTVPRRRRRRARSDLLAAFPEEIQQEILARLPPNSLLRCRAVCRSWRRLASDPAFLLHHHRLQPKLQLISTCRTAGGDDDGYVRRLEAFHLRRAEARPVFGFPNHFRSSSRFPVTASCDGLLVVGRYYICNPATRQWGSLTTNPNLHIERVVGLFRHQPSGEYRVLYWTHSSMPYTLPIIPPDVPCPNEYRVLTVGTSESRLVDCPLARMIGELGPIIYGAPVLLDGTLHVHWMMRWAVVRYHKILVFDTVAETFRHMIPPSVNPRHAMHLLDMCGRLAVAVSKDRVTGMTIFVLQDKERDVWAFHYRIKLPVMDIRRFQEKGNLWAEVVSEEGDVLVCCYGHLLHCDKNGKLVANFKYDDDLPVVLPHRLKESLIQHTFFQKTES